MSALAPLLGGQADINRAIYELQQTGGAMIGPAAESLTMFLGGNRSHPTITCSAYFVEDRFAL
jgi:hypothetical protein